ncbi:hypothetical protein BKA66DRAFT_447716 [Pyrenochaeta sp. MPI-SDFR-AT-0127]|nr:hypothetical protein BKA66DRAFT_447716 [Pyrenochaeta sp. MPI-SDFR-AT-0127]
MKHSAAVLFGLATAICAVDIRCHPGLSSACQSGWTVACTNVNPNVCCFNSGTEFSSASIVAVPRGWQLAAEGFTNPDCTVHATQQDNYPTQPDMCLHFVSDPVKQLSLRSAKYWFGQWSKRDAGTSTASAPGSECTAYQQVDTLTFEDGTKFSIENIGEDDLQKFASVLPFPNTSIFFPITNLSSQIAIANNGTNPAEIPDQLKVFQIGE